MKIRSRRDFWAGLVFIAIGVAFAWGAAHYRLGNAANPGPGYFPLGLGVVLALLGAAILFKALVVETDDGEPLGRWPWRAFATIVSAVALFGALLPRLGLVATLPLLVLAASLGHDEFGWREALLSAVVLTLLAWLVFVRALGLALPLWPPALAG